MGGMGHYYALINNFLIIDLGKICDIANYDGNKKFTETSQNQKLIKSKERRVQ
jgi:hypothetical protein